VPAAAAGGAIWATVAPPAAAGRAPCRYGLLPRCLGQRVLPAAPGERATRARTKHEREGRRGRQGSRVDQD